MNGILRVSAEDYFNTVSAIATMPRRSLQDLIRAQQQSVFVGREEQLDLFRKTVGHPRTYEDGTRFFDHLIFNIWGQGGVGKSTLLGQFQQIAQNVGFVWGSVDEGVKDLPGVLERFAAQFRQQGHALSKFEERARIYREKCEESEADPEAPQGMAAFVGRTAARTGLRFAKKVPVGGDVIEELVDSQALIEQGGEWAAYWSRKLKNKDDKALLLQPERVLTQLFLEELGQVAERKDVLLCFDTYEETDRILDEWLRALLADGEYGAVPTNIVIAVFGRKELDRNNWSALGSCIVRQSLEAFTEEEARSFLARKEIRDAHTVDVILEISGRLPLLLATLVDGSPMDADSVGDASGTAVERFLKWVDNPVQRQLALDASLPRRLNQDVVACLAGEEQAEELFGWLKDRPFVKERSDGWVYHEVVQSQMLRYLRKRSEQDWKNRHQKLATYFSGLREALQLSEDAAWKDEQWQGFRLDELYHQLCVLGNQGIDEVINGFLKALRERRVFAERWSAVVSESAECCDAKKVLEWGERLSAGLRAYKEKRYGEAIVMFSAILARAEVQNGMRATVLAWRGESYRLALQYEAALKDFDQAIELDSEYRWALASRGETYQLMKRYEDAITDYSQTIELDSEDQWSLASRGEIYQLIERYEDAITDFNRAIEIDSEFKWALALRGYTYRLMERYEDAITDYSQIIELDSEDQWALASRGYTYRLMERYEDAITDFNRAIEIDSEFKWAISERSYTYQLMERYEDAIADYSLAIKIDSEDKGLIGLRGCTYQLMGRFDDAINDFNRAIELDSEDKFAIASRGHTYKLLERFDDAINDFNRAIELDLEDELEIAQRGETYWLMKNYEKSLADFTRAVEIDPEYSSAIKNKAKIHLILQQYLNALPAINRALELEPQNDRYYYIRTLTYFALKSSTPAKADLSQAIQITQLTFDKKEVDWSDKLNLPLYYLVAQNPKKAKALYQKVLNENPPIATLKEAIRDLEDLLTILPNYPNAQNFLNALQKELQKRQK